VDIIAGDVHSPGGQNPITRGPFEAPLEAKTAFLMKLNETAMAISDAT